MTDAGGRWLLLAHRGEGLAVRIEQFVTVMGVPETSEDALTVQRASMNEDTSGPAAESLKTGGRIALRLVARHFRQALVSTAAAHAGRRLGSIKKLIAKTEPLPGTYEGRSGDLIYALAAFLDLMSSYGLGMVPARSLAATGELDEDGYVKEISDLDAKLTAAISTLPANGIVFYPRNSDAQVGETTRKAAREAGLELRPVERIEEALRLLGVAVRGWRDGSPYRALETYRIEDGPIFFGRDLEVAEFIERLQDWSGSGRAGGLVMAGSGAGKSSFVQAGVLATLRSQHERAPLEYAVWRPSDAAGSGGGRISETDVVGSVLCNWAAGDDLNSIGFQGVRTEQRPANLLALATLLERSGLPGRRLVWVVDQFEELFTQSFDADARIAFARLLEALQAMGVCVIATLRDEFYPRLESIKDKGGCPILFNVFKDRFFPLLDMPAAAMAEVISGPARVAGRRFAITNGLPLDAVILVDALATRSMPSLGYALHELWQWEQKDDPAKARGWRPAELTLEAYVSVGRVQGAIDKIAEEAFASVSEEARRTLPQLLDQLAVPDDAGQHDLARSASLSTWHDRRSGRQLVDALVNRGLLTTYLKEDRSEGWIRVVHESVFGIWARARAALGDSRLARLQRKSLQFRAARWADSRARLGDRSAGWLLTGPNDLEIARAIRAGLGPDRDDRQLASFIDASLRARSRRRAIEGLVLMSMLALVGLVVGIQWSRAEAQRDSVRQRAANAVGEGRQQLERGDPKAALQAGLTSLAIRDASLPNPAEEALLLRAMLMDRTLRMLPSHRDPLGLAEISPDRRYLLTAGRDNTVRVLDLADAAGAHRSLGHTDKVTFAAFGSLDGKIVTATTEEIILWAVSGTKLGTHRLAKGERIEAVSTRLEYLLISAGMAPYARILRLSESRSETFAHPAAIRHAAFAQDGLYMITSGSDGAARIWETTTSTQPLQVIRHGAAQTQSYGEGVAFSARGDWAAAAFDDGAVHLCRLQRPEKICSVVSISDEGAAAPQLRVRLRFSPEGRYVAVTASEDGPGGKLRIWSLREEPVLVAGYALDWQPDRLDFSDSGSKLLVSGSGSRAAVIDLSAWTLATSVVSRSAHATRAVVIGPGHREATFLTAQGEIIVWDLESRYPRRSIAAHPRAILDARFDPEGNFITAKDDLQRQLRWFVGPASTERVAAPAVTNVEDAAVGPDSQRHEALAASDSDESLAPCSSGQAAPVSPTVEQEDPGGRTSPEAADVRARTVARYPQAQRAFQQPHSVRCAVVSPDGIWLATADASFLIRLWSLVDSGQAPKLLAGHVGDVTDLQFSGNGRRLISASDDRTARLWMIDGGEIASVVLEGHNKGVHRARFARSGELALTLSRDNNLRVWDLPAADRLVAAAKHAAPRCVDSEREGNGHCVGPRSVDGGT